MADLDDKNGAGTRRRCSWTKRYWPPSAASWAKTVCCPSISSLKAPTAEVVMSRSMYHLAKKIARLLQKRVHEVKRAVGYALAWEELIAAGE